MSRSVLRENDPRSLPVPALLGDASLTIAMEQILLVTETGTELLTPFTDELWVAPVG